MKKAFGKKEAENRINEFFQRSDWGPEELKKIKRIAMKYKIRLGSKRKLFCKKCYYKLKGKIKASKTHKMIKCEKCSFVNKFKIS